MAGTVSVVIPTYNREKIISTALESVLAQTYTDYEIIVIDDGSTDSTRDLIRSYADRQVHYFYQDNKGIAGARNAGIRTCSGAHIAFLDSDDYWLPGKLEQQMALFDQDPEYGLVASCCASVRYDGSFRATNRSGKSGRVLRELFIKNYIRTSAAVVTRQCLEKVGLFDESLKECEEYDLWLRIAAEYPIGFINEPLAVYVDNPAGVSTDSLIGRLYRLQVLEKDYLRQRIPRRLYCRRIADTCHYIGRHYLSRGQAKEGRAYLRRAQRLAPLYIKNLIYLGLSLLRTS